MLDEKEFLSPYGIRSISQFHRDHPFKLEIGGRESVVDYEPGESTTSLFGGNSNWRGPIWFPVNYLIIGALLRFARRYGDSLRVEFPRGSGKQLTVAEITIELAERLVRIFLPGDDGQRPLFDDTGDELRYALEQDADDVWRGHVAGIGHGARYGFRARGTWDPARGLRCNEAKLLLDPYARAIEGAVDWNPAVYGNSAEDSAP